MILVGVTSSGTRSWSREKSAGCSGTHQCYALGNAVAVDASGAIVVAGSSWFGGSGWEIDGWRYAATGVLGSSWLEDSNILGADDLGLAVAADPLGGVVLTGQAPGPLSSSPGPVGMFVEKRDAANVRTWVRQYDLSSGAGDNGHGVGNGIAIDASGNIYVVGTASGGFNGAPAIGGSDLFLLKI
jgi:hypothetical protein